MARMVAGLQLDLRFTPPSERKELRRIFEEFETAFDKADTLGGCSVKHVVKEHTHRLLQAVGNHPLRDKLSRALAGKDVADIFYVLDRIKREG